MLLRTDSSERAESEVNNETDLIAVAAVDNSFAEQAKELAERLDLPLLEEFDLSRCEYDLLLLCAEQGVRLQVTGRKAPGPVAADFIGGAVDHRRKHGGGKGQMIAKAVGIKGSLRPKVADVTAGLGRDSFVLATLGCEMQMVERSPIIHALLESGLERASQVPEVADITARMQLIHADSILWLQGLKGGEQRPDVVYVDPMFPHNDKSALVKKEMRVFRSIVGDDQDAEALLKAALDVAEYRVVVKRARKAPLIEGPTLEGVKPSYQLEGKSSRYDIYTLKKLA
ncbi:MAG: class I SAM-dependent methyltransferase [Amphritea sp.]